MSVTKLNQEILTEKKKEIKSRNEPSILKRSKAKHTRRLTTNKK